MFIDNRELKKNKKNSYMEDLFTNEMKDLSVLIDRLQELKERCILDESQSALAVILECGKNWRLIERILEYATDIKNPENRFIKAICSVIVNDRAYINSRILAAEALRILGPRKIEQNLESPVFKGVSIQETLKEILELPQAPLFRSAVAKALEAINKFQN